MTYTQYLVMMVLWEFGGMTEGELGKKVRLDSGTLTPLLKRLDKQGYIRRTRPDDDERKLFLSLTEQGEALKEKAEAVPSAMQGCIPLEQEELLLLKSLLDQALNVALHTVLFLDPRQDISVSLDVELHTDVFCVHGVIPRLCFVLRAARLSNDSAALYVSRKRWQNIKPREE